jgi:hypothetical protein
VSQRRDRFPWGPCRGVILKTTGATQAVSGRQFLSECQTLREDQLNVGGSSKRVETRSTVEYKRSACDDVLCEWKTLRVIITEILKSVIITCIYDLEVVNKTNYQSEGRLQYPNTSDTKCNALRKTTTCLSI